MEKDEPDEPKKREKNLKTYVSRVSPKKFAFKEIKNIFGFQAKQD